LFEGLFDIDDTGVIYLFTPDHSSWSKYPECQEIHLNLHNVDFIRDYIAKKVDVTTLKEQPKKDCPAWLCKFCEYKDACSYIKEEEKVEFGDES
jgi:CRISPR/Cas system-associated exonuclease Cas4 (RecB family)